MGGLKQDFFARRFFRSTTQPTVALWLMVVAQAMIWAAVAGLSVRFAQETPPLERPLLLVLLLMAICFGLHLVSLKIALQSGSPRRTAVTVVLAALLFRGILLPTAPIQEIDLYRYLWDGAASANGVSPYRHSPQEVLAADASTLSTGGLSALATLRDESPALAEILRRVHYPELTTVYPPVSQLVFAAVNYVCPATATVGAHVVAMKAAMLLFDMATIATVLTLLVMTGRHVGWCIAYAWNPLVLKEFANSGHLDAIAVCLTTVALVVWLAGMRSSGRSGAALLALSAAILGAAVAAKLFPIVLLPLLVAVTARRQGWLAAATFGAVGLLAAAVLLLPMLPAGVAANGQGGNAVANRDEVSAPANTKVIEPSQRSTNGLVVFLRQWEINDLIFLVVYENLVPPTGTPQAVDQNPSAPIPWFSVVPNRWRNAIVTPLAARSNVPPREAAFFLARGITLAIFVGIAAWVGYWAARSDNRAIWLEAAFLTLAWFWALSPTQNPWYWTWAMPLLPFARNRAWFAVSGLLLLYYLRFWLAVHDVDWGYWGLADRGENLFHFVVVPIEQGIWLTWLLLETLFRGKSTSV